MQDNNYIYIRLATGIIKIKYNNNNILILKSSQLDAQLCCKKCILATLQLC